MCTDVLALGHAHHGNAHRVLCNWAQAEKAYKAALDFLWEGTGDLETNAEVLRLYGSYLRDRKQLPEIIAALDEAAKLYRVLGDSHREGLSLLKLAGAFGERGELETALSIHHRACVLIDEHRAPIAAAAAWNNLALMYADSGRFEDAASILESSPSFYDFCPADSSVHLSRIWAEGRVLAGLGKHTEALERFDAARVGFDTHRHTYNVALILLEMVKVFLLQQDWDKAQHFSQEAFQRLRKEPLEREAAEALHLVLVSASSRQLVETMVNQATRALLRSPIPGQRAPAAEPD